jgi:hypothetical protein
VVYSSNAVWLLAGRRVGLRRGGAMDTVENGERAATAVFDRQ